MATLVPDLLRDLAMAEPARVAHVVDGGSSLTYQSWERRSNALARGLADMGVRPGDRVGLLFESSGWVEYAVAYMGVVKAGAVAVPLSSRFTGPELLAVLDRAGVEGTVTGSVRPRAPGWHITVEELEEGYSDEAFQVPVRATDVVEILYTSGTTGLPKGVACTHAHIVRPLVERGGWVPWPWRECAGGLYLHANALSTAGGQLRLFEPLTPERMTTLALPDFDTDRFCLLADQCDAAVVQLVPAMALAILSTGAYRRHDLSRVRVVELGCAPLPPSVLPDLDAAFGNATLINVYTLSEARYTGTAMIHDGQKPISVGLPFGGSEVQVTDSHGRPLAPGPLGEVRLRRPGLEPQHYYGDAKATADVFVDGWTRTGDVGYLDEDGHLYVVDRTKDVIIKGGLNVSSVVVESALLEHPAVVEAAVVGLPDDLHGEDVAAAVVLRTAVSVDELRAFARDRLAAHEVPGRITGVAELPRNRSGKVLKSSLREQLVADARPASFSPQGSHGDTLAAIWAEVLGRNTIEPDDDFFSLGGDSIQASQVTGRIRHALGVDVPVTAVFEHRTMAELSRFVEELSRSGVPAHQAPIPRLPRPGEATSACSP